MIVDTYTYCYRRTAPMNDTVTLQNLPEQTRIQIDTYEGCTGLQNMMKYTQNGGSTQHLLLIAFQNLSKSYETKEIHKYVEH